MIICFLCYDWFNKLSTTLSPVCTGNGINNSENRLSPVVTQVDSSLLEQFESKVAIWRVNEKFSLIPAAPCIPDFGVIENSRDHYYFFLNIIISRGIWCPFGKMKITLKINKYHYGYSTNPVYVTYFVSAYQSLRRSTTEWNSIHPVMTGRLSTWGVGEYFKSNERSQLLNSFSIFCLS